MKTLDENLLSEILAPRTTPWAFVLDADRTLASPDTGRLVGAPFGVNEPIRSVFEDEGYSADAFLRVAEIWASIPDDDYLGQVQKVATEVVLHDIWRRVFDRFRAQTHIVVVTSGIPQVWRHVLAFQGFGDLQVIGGCRLGTDEYVVCPQGKRAVVRAFQNTGAKVIAAGDSEIDLPMLHEANIGLVVPDYKGSRRLFANLPAEHDLKYLKMDENNYPIPSITEDELRITVEGDLC